MMKDALNRKPKDKRPLGRVNKIYINQTRFSRFLGSITWRKWQKAEEEANVFCNVTINK